MRNFRSSITRPQHWLFTLRAAITERRRKTRFRGLAILSRVGLHFTH